MATITASTAVVLRSTGSAGTLAWRTEPPEALQYCTPIQVLGEPALLLAWPDRPRVVVLLIATNGATIVTDRFVIPPNGADSDPIVDPVPHPAPTTITQIVIVRQTELAEGLTEEEAKAAALQKVKEAAIVLDQGWREAAREAGLTPEVRDKNHLLQTRQHLAELHKPNGGPVVCFLDADDKLVTSAPLPDSVEGLTALVEEKVR